MNKGTKKQNADGRDGKTHRSVKGTPKHLEAYFLARETLRRIRRTSELFVEVPLRKYATTRH